MTDTFNYFAFGLHIASELECPELLPADPAPPDVWVRLGPTGDTLGDPPPGKVIVDAGPDVMQFVLDEVGRYSITGGDQIVIQRFPQAGDDKLRIYLLGAAFGALLYQRGFFPLHGSAIETSHGAVAFTGDSGNGKSTMAAAFHQRGCRILADDVCAIRLDDAGQPVVVPAFPQLNLWNDSLEKLGQTSTDLPRTRLYREKYGLAVWDGFRSETVPLRAVYQLVKIDAAEAGLQAVKGTEKIRLLRDNTARRFMLNYLPDDTPLMRTLMVAAKTCRVARLVYPPQPFQLDELADLLEKDINLL